MAAPGMYLVCVSICLAALYLLYVVFFRTTTFFELNRYFLLGSLVLSFIIPLLDVSLFTGEYRTFLSDHITATFHSPEEESMLREPIALSGKTMEHMPVFSIIYYVGAMIMLLRICYSLRNIRGIKSKAERSYYGNTRVFRAESLKHPFSFFSSIFLPTYDISPVIIEHEKVHIRQLHSIDLMLAEIATVVLWFNPIMFFFKRSVRAQHEYLADAGVIRKGVQIDDYLNVLLQQIQAETDIGPISHFYSKSIKNRIMMITKNETSIRFSGVYLLAIPVCCMLLFAFSNKPAKMPFLNRDVAVVDSGLTIIVDPGHGGSDFGARSASGLAEKKLTLSIAKNMQQIGKREGVRVILTRKDDGSLSLEQRASFSEEYPAKLFISLHVNIHDTDASKSGIDCVISENNAGFEQSKKFSDHLVKELKTIKGIKVNGIMKSDFYILKNNSIPALTLQLGYLSNEDDYKFLGQDENQKLLAEMIISGIKHLQ